MALTIHRSADTELIDGCKSGNKRAQQQLFNRYSGKIYGICSRYLKSTPAAEDALVMTFTKVFDRIHQFKGEGSFEGWIRRIAVNESLTALRQSRAMVVETDLEKADHEPDYSLLSDHLVADDLLKMIESLPPGYRVVFNLYAIDGYSHKEIADQLGISENTSKSQLSRARTFLQKMLTDREGELRSNVINNATQA